MKLFRFLLFFVPGWLEAQQPIVTSSDILQGLRKLNTVGSVLYIAAHPDDENTRLLAWLSAEKNLRTGYLSITRGDGGQNLIGKEQGELLGLIRTQELLAARRTDGAEQFFTRANDFGYSKSPEETLEFWNMDSILADVVWVIRNFQPDVIICRFPATGEGGHGHHTASAVLALEAFDAAADPNRFKEQLGSVQPWKTRRIFWNTFNFGSANTTAADQIKADVGAFNPLLGKGYGEIASESRSMHKSQGFGAAKTRGETLEYFKWLKGDSVKQDIFEGMDFSWKRIKGAEQVEGAILKCLSGFYLRQPEKSVPDLIAIHTLLLSLPEADPFTKQWKAKKLKETEDLILACLGLWFEAGAADHLGIPGRKIQYSVQAVLRNNFPVILKKVTWLDKSDSITNLPLQFNKLYTFRHKELIPASTPYSNPYWLNAPHSIGLFTVKDRALIGKPESDPALNVEFTFEINKAEFKIRKNLTYKFTDPVKGEVYRPFEVLPPATVTAAERLVLFTGPAEKKKVTFTVKANADSLSGFLELAAPEGWVIHQVSDSFFLKKKGDEAVMEAFISAGPGNRSKLMATLRIQDEPYRKGITRIEYDHIPYQFYLTDADVQLVRADLKKGKTKIAYIPGAGDDVAACLGQAGYDVTVLTDEMVEKENLSVYAAILTGVRAFNTNERLAVQHKKLMDYVAAGGNLIVQYNTNSRVGPLKGSLGPYPFTISRNRVTDENAEVRFTKPAHPALNSPNKITAEDFNGWIQERGIYFAEERDKNYETILSMNDKGEKPLEGSLIIAKHGKGNFVYTGLVFFRELPAGVPGAYRLIANLIALPQNK